MVPPELCTEMENKQLLEAFCNYMASGLLARSADPGSDVWPQPVFHPMEAVYFASEEMLGELHTALNRLSAEGKNTDEIARLVQYPSSAAHLTYLFLEKPVTEEQAKIRAEDAVLLLKIISSLRNGNPFCEKGPNYVWTEAEARNRIAAFPMEELEKHTSADYGHLQLGRLNVALSCYCEMLYFSNITFGREIHGPYCLGETGSALVRDYHDLHPEYWNFPSQLPFESARVITTYAILQGRVDFSGRFSSQGALGAKISRAYVAIDGESIALSSNDFRQLLSAVEASIDLAAREARGMSKPDLITRYAAGFGEALQRLTGREADNGWRISKALRKRIHTEKTESHTLRILRALPTVPEADRLGVIQALFDPTVSRDALRVIESRIRSTSG